jgi:hypothetical protein
MDGPTSTELRHPATLPLDGQRRLVYAELFTRAVSYFLPEYSLAAMEHVEGADADANVFSAEAVSETAVELHWLGNRYSLCPSRNSN